MTMGFQSMKTILSKSELQAKLAARIAQDEQKRAHGVLTYGWSPSCDCVDCGDNGIDPRTMSPCWCDAGREANRQHDRLLAWNKMVPELQRNLTLGGHPNRKVAESVGQWVEAIPQHNDPKGPNLILVGPVGTGKTGAAVGAMRVLHFSGAYCIYGTLPFIMESLRPVQPGMDATALRMSIDRVVGAGLLVIDDLGTEKRGEWVAERLTMIVDERHKRNKPTIMTTNLKPDELPGAVGERIASRLTAGATIVPVGGDDLRRQMQYDIEERETPW